MAVSSRAHQPLGDAPLLRGSDEMRTVLRAWGRHQAALWQGAPQLFTELDLTMALAGAASVRALDRAFLTPTTPRL